MGRPTFDGKVYVQEAFLCAVLIMKYREQANAQ